jgi:hypothetical protein
MKAERRTLKEMRFIILRSSFIVHRSAFIPHPFPQSITDGGRAGK